MSLPEPLPQLPPSWVWPLGAMATPAQMARCVPLESPTGAPKPKDHLGRFLLQTSRRKPAFLPSSASEGSNKLPMGRMKKRTQMSIFCCLTMIRHLPQQATTLENNKELLSKMKPKLCNTKVLMTLWDKFLYHRSKKLQNQDYTSLNSLKSLWGSFWPCEFHFQLAFWVLKYPLLLSCFFIVS